MAIVVVAISDHIVKLDEFGFKQTLEHGNSLFLGPSPDLFGSQMELGISTDLVL